jgi:hypothetical protein
LVSAGDKGYGARDKENKREQKGQGARGKRRAGKKVKKKTKDFFYAILKLTDGEAEKGRYRERWMHLVKPLL